MKKILGILNWDDTDPLVTDSVNSPLSAEDREALQFQKREAEEYQRARRAAFRATQRSTDTRSPFKSIEKDRRAP